MAGYVVVGGAALVVLVAWLVALTVTLLRWRAEHGQPVYRRLPHGRLRFEWNVDQAYRSVASSTDRIPPTGASRIRAEVSEPRWLWPGRR